MAFHKPKLDANGIPVARALGRVRGDGVPKLNPVMAKKICDLLAFGNYVETAVACVGMNKDTFYAWMRRGRIERSGAYHEFALAVDRAQAEAESRDVLYIAKAAETSWKAAAWRLERRLPNRWSRRVEVSGPEGGPVRLELDSGSLLEQLRRLAGEPTPTPAVSQPAIATATESQPSLAGDPGAPVDLDDT